MVWIGVVDEVAERWLWLREVRPDATWRKRPRGYQLSRTGDRPGCRSVAERV
jgi:hypothetical protein